jgi:hypothetical protein
VNARRQVRAGSVAAVVLTALFAFTGCSGDHAKTETSTRSSHETHFSGPYADDFETAYEKAASEKERRILQDGVVTSQEFEEAKSGIRTCMADSGYTISWDDRGGFDVAAEGTEYDRDYQKKMDPILQECERKNDGDVTFLYRQTVVNPQKEDDRVAMRKCVIREGLVPKALSQTEFNRQYDSGDLPFSQFDPKGMACMDDPLGLWAKRQ